MRHPTLICCDEAVQKSIVQAIGQDQSLSQYTFEFGTGSLGNVLARHVIAGNKNLQSMESKFL